MIVVLDTCIWLQELALNSTLGAAVRFYLRQRNAQLALPEVVRLEVERNFRDKIKEYIAKIRDNHRKLLTVFGKLKEAVLPDETAIEDKIAEIFSGVGVELLQIDFSLESARSSFLKTINKMPPSDQGQQFKDGVLWADCIALLERDDVLLVTSDTAFFHQRKYEEGLAKNLLAEVFGKAHQLKVFKSLGELLVDVRTEFTLDQAALIESFMKQHGQLVDNMLHRNSFRLEQVSDVDISLYATESPSILYIEFAMDFPCSDLSDQDRTSAILHLSGTGSYNVETGKYDDIRITGLELNFLLADGTSKQSVTNILAAADIIIGYREVEHNPRYKITEENR